MSKKHFAAIAKVLRTVKGDTETLNTVIEALADTFGEFNPRFDRSRFIDACLPDPAIARRAERNGS